MFNCIIFDFDGTLADTAPGIISTANETFRRMGVPVPQEDRLRATIGLPLGESLKIAGDLPESRVQEAMETYRTLFSTLEVSAISIFPGVPETLDILQHNGIRMAIATSRGADSLEMILSRYGIRDYFETYTTADDKLASKPAPDMVLTLLKRMSMNPGETLVVGDTTFDIGMGNSAGCKTCAVTYGNHPKERLQTANPDHIIDRFSELARLI